MVSQESADGEVLGQVITSFKVHPPSAGFVGKAVADRKIELPVDVGVERVTGLCTALLYGMFSFLFLVQYSHLFRLSYNLYLLFFRQLY